MADGDKLTLGELQNSATSMTRLVGRVDDSFAFRVDQEGTGGQAIMAIGTIFGFGRDSSSQPGGTGVSGQGGKGVPSQGGGVGVVGNGGGAAMVFGASLPQPATLGYSALTSASALACVVLAPCLLLAAYPPCSQMATG
jgi:hypothetical protein